MPITFEEVTAEIAPPPPTAAAGSGTAPTAPAAPADELRDRLAAELRLLAERRARHAAD